jgi:hypothetical protein
VATQANAALKLGEERVERRERRPVSLRGFVIREDETNVEILLLDLSYEGCGIETPVDLSAGESVKLSVMRRGAIEARVLWCRDGRAGLIFAPEDTTQREYCPRGADRTKLTAEVSLRRLGKLNYRVTVYDISPTGCKVELVDKPRLEEHVLIKFVGLESLEAEVCWIEGPCAGLRFEKPIHPAVFDLLLSRLG